LSATGAGGLAVGAGEANFKEGFVSATRFSVAVADGPSPATVFNPLTRTLLDAASDHGVELLVKVEIVHQHLVVMRELEKVALRPEFFADVLFCFFARLVFAPSSCFDLAAPIGPRAGDAAAWTGRSMLMAICAKNNATPCYVHTKIPVCVPALFLLGGINWSLARLCVD
jgi:hypothetical protein